MYINSESDLEEYICQNIEEFISFLKELYEDENINTEKIKFVGRQVVLGDSRFDLLFEIKEEIDDPFFEFSKTFIVVELKYRKAETKDFAQLSRYLTLLNSFSTNEMIKFPTLINTKGILLTTGLNDDMQDIQMYINDYTDANIKFVSINTKLDFKQDNYFYKDEFLQDMKIDNRLINTEQEEIKCGKKTND